MNFFRLSTLRTCYVPLSINKLDRVIYEFTVCQSSRYVLNILRFSSSACHTFRSTTAFTEIEVSQVWIKRTKHERHDYFFFRKRVGIKSRDMKRSKLY